jgi:hypothetical protein
MTAACTSTTRVDRRVVAAAFFVPRVLMVLFLASPPDLNRQRKADEIRVLPHYRFDDADHRLGGTLARGIERLAGAVL